MNPRFRLTPFESDRTLQPAFGCSRFATDRFWAKSTPKNRRFGIVRLAEIILDSSTILEDRNPE